MSRRPSRPRPARSGRSSSRGIYFRRRPPATPRHPTPAVSAAPSISSCAAPGKSRWTAAAKPNSTSPTGTSTAIGGTDSSVGRSPPTRSNRRRPSESRRRITWTRTSPDANQRHAMSTPFTRVSTVTEAQRLLMRRGAVIAPPGRTTAGLVEHPAGRPGRDRRPRGDRDNENFNPDGSRKDRHERKPRFKVELLCRTFAGDVGLRPLPNMVFWESPDIAIEGPSGDPDVATPGVVNKVKVHVWNLGLADCWAAHV